MIILLATLITQVLASCNYDPRGLGSRGHNLTHTCDLQYRASTTGPGALTKCERLSNFIQCIASSGTGCTTRFASLMCAAKASADPELCEDADTRCGVTSSCSFPVITQADFCVRSLDATCVFPNPPAGQCWFDSSKPSCLREVKKCFWVRLRGLCSHPPSCSCCFLLLILLRMCSRVHITMCPPGDAWVWGTLAVFSYRNPRPPIVFPFTNLLPSYCPLPSHNVPCVLLHVLPPPDSLALTYAPPSHYLLLHLLCSITLVPPSRIHHDRTSLYVL